MKLHTHIRKLFDSANIYIKAEKKLAKQNQRKARGTGPLQEWGLGRRFRYGFLWWRSHAERGQKNARGQLLPRNQTNLPEA